MSDHIRTNLTLTIAVCLFATLIPALRAQTGGMGGDFAEKTAENSKKLKQYSYLQTTKIYFKGEMKTTKLARVHYDASGEKVTVPLDTPAPQEAQQANGRQGRLGALKQKKIAEKKDELKDYTERVIGLMGQYLPPNPDRMKAALPKAQITPNDNGKAKIALSDYLKPGDKMVMSIDPATKSLTEIMIDSSLDTDPVSFQVNFNKLPDGTNYPSLTTINAPAKEMKLEVSGSDYQKLN
jgi:hypothetical protein